MTSPESSGGLDLRNIVKSYGATRAVRGVSLHANSGEVTALLGENGAGKSTLMKIISGVERADEGELLLDGKTLQVASTRDALRQGVILVPQEITNVPDMTVADNILLGRWAARGGWTTQSRVLHEAEQYARRVGLSASVERPMSSLSLAEAQLVEIAKALSRNARVLLLDEPTASLSEAESNRLFALLRSLRSNGVTILYISHRLDEVVRECDKIVVLRNGTKVADQPAVQTSTHDIVRLMLGREPARLETRTVEVSERPPALRLTALHHAHGGLNGVDLAVRRGELVGLFGVLGAGQESLVETLVGLRPHSSGTIEVDSKPVGTITSPTQAHRLGLVYVPPDRRSQGLVLSQSIAANLAIPRLKELSKWGFVVPRRQRELVGQVTDDYRVRFASVSQAVGELSGGNQQKILIGSRLRPDAAALIIHEPTRGVDVGARQEIHRSLRTFADRGAAVLLATTDVEEAVDLCDRVCILREGRIVAELTAGDRTQTNALSAATA